MEAHRATETTLMMMMMMMMFSGMVMTRREQLVSTNSRHNVKVWLAPVRPAMTWNYVLKGCRLDNHPVILWSGALHYGASHCRARLDVLVESREHTCKAIRWYIEGLRIIRRFHKPTFSVIKSRNGLQLLSRTHTG